METLNLFVIFDACWKAAIILRTKLNKSFR